jgi:lysophospholipase L1-like esterase
MKKKFAFVAIPVIFFELVLMVYLGFQIYQKKSHNILGATSVATIKKENLVFSPEGNLQYFYESKPDTTETDTALWLPQPVTYTFNSDGLNDRYNYSVEKPAGVFRIIALGDSFTFGHYVNTKDAWPEQLEDILNNGSCKTNKKFEVINLGEPGYDVQYIAHRYEKRGIKYNPDLIIWLESSTGFTRFNEFLQPLVTKYENSLTQEELAQASKSGDFWPAWTKAYDDLYRMYTKDEISAYIHSAWQDFFRKRGDVPVLVTMFSSESEEQKNLLQSWISGQPHTFFYPNLSDITALKGVYPDGHPNVEGHALIAEDLYKYLQNNTLIPCVSSTR